MGVLRLFGSIIQTLHANPRRATEDGLDKIAANARRFSYIGNRKTLSKSVRQEAEELAQRLRALPTRGLESADRTLAETIKAIKRNAADATNDIIYDWLGREWEKDSGIFPDFLLALDESATFANGALLELKDSKGDSIASFNSTIPTRLKSLKDVRRITGSNLVANAARLCDFPLSADPDYLTNERSCFYLVRTWSKDKSKVRISLVEGSFFETLPKDQLMAQVWDQILDAGGVTQAERPHIVELLAGLEQSEIARSREIKQASVKPRLRLMAEVHGDAKLHSYAEIMPRTVNLVIKREAGFDKNWLQREFGKEGLEAKVVRSDGAESIALSMGRNELKLRYFAILHKRNGEHIVLQYNLR